MCVAFPFGCARHAASHDRGTFSSLLYQRYTTRRTALHRTGRKRRKRKKEKKGQRSRRGEERRHALQSTGMFCASACIVFVVDFLGRRPRKILRTPGCCISAETMPSWRRMLHVGRPGRLSDGEGSPRDREIRSVIFLSSCFLFCLMGMQPVGRGIGGPVDRRADVACGGWHGISQAGPHNEGGMGAIRHGMSSPGESLSPFTSNPNQRHVDD